MMVSACTGATWGVPVEPISVPGAWKRYTRLHNWTSTCFMHVHMGHPSVSLPQACSDSIASMAYISINSLLNTLIIVMLNNIYCVPNEKDLKKPIYIVYCFGEKKKDEIYF